MGYIPLQEGSTYFEQQCVLQDCVSHGSLISDINVLLNLRSGWILLAGYHMQFQHAHVELLEEVVLVLSGLSWQLKSQKWSLEAAQIQTDFFVCLLSTFAPLDGYLISFQGSSTERRSWLELTQLHSRGTKHKTKLQFLSQNR